MDQNVEIFNPTKAEIARRVEESKSIVCTDFRDLVQVENVKRKRKELRGIEIDIENTGKDAREDARKYAQKIIDMEKELKSITGPEIVRLDGMLNEAVKIRIRDERLQALPVRKQRLESLNDGVEVDDEQLLTLDASGFDAYYNDRLFTKQENERIEAQKKIDEENDKIRIEREKLEADKRELARQQEIKNAEERARVAEQERTKREAEALEQDKRDEEVRLAKEESLKPDKEKLCGFADTLDMIVVPEMSDKEMQAIANQVKILLTKVSNYIRTNTK